MGTESNSNSLFLFRGLCKINNIYISSDLICLLAGLDKSLLLTVLVVGKHS